MSIEIWKTIIDFPEYEISSLGRVREKESNKILKEKESLKKEVMYNEYL